MGFPPASVPDWDFCSPGFFNDRDFELVGTPATEETRCVCSALIMGDSGVDLIPWLGFALSCVAGCSSGMSLGGAVSIFSAGGFVAGAGLCFISAKGWELPVLPVCRT